MEEFIDMLNESLQPEITDFFGIQISTAIVTTWGIMAVLMILTLIFVRNLKLWPTTSGVSLGNVNSPSIFSGIHAIVLSALL